MNLSLLENIDHLKKAQSAFELVIKQKLTALENYKIGFSGKSWDGDIRLNESIWFSSEFLEDDGSAQRYWNAFGLVSELHPAKSNNITVEINIALNGLNRRVSGAFATDEQGRIYLLHRGKIGGGRKGIGKAAFLNWTSTSPHNVSSTNGLEDCIVIGDIHAANFIEELANFIRNVHQFKQFVTSKGVDRIELLSLDEIENQIELIDKSNPTNNVSELSRFKRSNLIKEHALKRANGICQLCGNKAPFDNKHGRPFLEVHHIKWLSREGEDSIANTVGLCPNCHRKMHVLDTEADVQRLVNRNSGRQTR